MCKRMRRAGTGVCTVKKVVTVGLLVVSCALWVPLLMAVSGVMEVREHFVEMSRSKLGGDWLVLAGLIREAFS